MSDTPRTDVEIADFTCPEDAMVAPDFARQLERELAAVTKERDELITAVTSFSNDCRTAAACLDREIRTGECYRQSAESKHARWDILKAHEQWALNVIKRTENQ